MRSIVFWTAKLISRCDSSALRAARLRARTLRHCSISFRNASSTSAVPRFFFFVDSAYLSKEPLRMASSEKMAAISPQRSSYCS